MRVAIGYPVLSWYIPAWFFRTLSFIGDKITQLFRFKFPFNSQTYDKLFGSSHCSSLRIQKELGFSPKYPLQQLLPDIIKNYHLGKL